MLISEGLTNVQYRQLAPLLLKWKLQVECLISWFAEWYFVKGFQERQLFHQGQTEEQLQEQLRKCELEQRQLLFPCWRFRHHSGFALATRFLVYNSYRHIVEFSPLESREFHLPPLIIGTLSVPIPVLKLAPLLTHRVGALNAARGRLRTILHRSIHRPKIELVRASCECSAHINKGYEMALYQAKIWPFEEIEKTDSMGTILRRIPTFRYEAPESACEDSCHKNKNYNKLVDEAGTEVETYFGGLCLDCLDRTRPKTGDEHSDYWNHNRFHNERAWFKGCSFRHREPTWYNSFMGGEAAKDTLKAMAKAREEEPHYKDNKFNYARFERMARKRALELQKGQS